MTTEFTLCLSNCVVEFEKEFLGYFEDSEELTTWLAHTYRIHVCGHECIDYVYIYLKDGVADFNVKIGNYVYPAGSTKIKSAAQFENEVLARINASNYDI